jgi:hypothetical protein
MVIGEGASVTDRIVPGCCRVLSFTACTEKHIAARTTLST